MRHTHALGPWASVPDLPVCYRYFDSFDIYIARSPSPIYRQDDDVYLGLSPSCALSWILGQFRIGDVCLGKFGRPRACIFSASSLQTALPRACNVAAKRGHPPWPVRRLGAFAQRGRAHCASWTTCRELFGLLFAQSARRIVPQRMLDVCRGGCWHHG